MKNNIIFLFAFFFVHIVSTYAQDLTIKELILLQVKDLDFDNEYLTNKGWEFNTSNVENTESLENYSVVGWSLNKNSWNDRAEAWFYLYQKKGMANAVNYQTHKANYNRLKQLVQNIGYKLMKTEAIDQGLITRYRSNNLEFVFTTSKSESDDYSSDKDIYYTIFIFNFKEIEDQAKAQAELERQQLEAERQLELEQQLIDEKYQNLVNRADSLFRNKKYFESKNTYIDASQIKPNENYPINKVSEINKIITFLEERKNKIFDYKGLEYSDYNSTNAIIVSRIKGVLLDKTIVGNANCKIAYTIDTIGRTTFEFNDFNNSSAEIINLIKPAIENIKLKTVYKNENTVNAKAEFEYSITMDNKIFDVKKNNVETTIQNDPSSQYRNEINSLVSSGPMGKYKVQIQNKEINSTDFSNNKIVKYKGIGGPSNLFLSVLVPGLGHIAVTGGTKSGIGTMVWTYGLIATGVGCKLWSNSEYNLYHKATKQEDIDSYYENANFLNQSFYCLTATGVVVWLYDIVWVANKGFKNKKAQKSYKKNYSFILEPSDQMFGMSCKLKF